MFSLMISLVLFASAEPTVSNQQALRSRIETFRPLAYDQVRSAFESFPRIEVACEPDDAFQLGGDRHSGDFFSSIIPRAPSLVLDATVIPMGEGFDVRVGDSSLICDSDTSFRCQSLRFERISAIPFNESGYVAEADIVERYELFPTPEGYLARYSFSVTSYKNDIFGRKQIAESYQKRFLCH